MSSSYFIYKIKILNKILQFFTFCLQSVFTCFMWASEQAAVASVYSTTCFVFITEKESVRCAVRAECLNILG